MRDRQKIYERVHAYAAGQRGYDSERTERIAGLVEEWITRQREPDSREAHVLEAMEGPDANHVRGAAYTACRDYVAREYRQRYGLGPLGFLLWPLLQAFIGWIVRRMLDEWFQ